MYDPALETYREVAECGSFTKAADKLYLTPTAVMKQMNAFESRVGAKLFERTPSGVKLTPAGEMLLKDARYIMDYSEKAVGRVRAKAAKYETTFCVGTSLLNPAKPFMDLWYRLKDGFPGYKLHLVPFEDDSDGILSEIGKLGEKFDFLIGVCDSKAWMSLCRFLPLGRYKKMIAVSREHRLAAKEKVNIEDLYGETLMMVKRGDSGVNDFLRSELEKEHPEIKIEDTPQFYDLSVFNRCAESDKVLLTIECWQDVHLGLVSIPVNWDYSIPYGLLYANDAPADVLRFVEAAREDAEKRGEF